MKTFKQLSTQCAACHSDPHKGQFPRHQCQFCHQTQGWTGNNLLFRHNTQTRFLLTGRHASVACAACHKDGRYRATPTQCAACHAGPHRGAIKQDCTACHSTAGFGPTNLKFDHDRQTRFPLTGLHAIHDCQACHADRTFRVAGTQCTACHGAAEEFYAGTLFRELTPPQPDTMHGRVRCEDCHKPTDTDAKSVTIQPRCTACHNEHYGRYLDEAERLIANRLAQWPSRTAQNPQSQRILEAISRYAPHNFQYAMHLLDLMNTPRKMKGAIRR